MKTLNFFLFLILTISTTWGQTSWTADNGNGTFTNPLFYDEFSDPDIIRVGDDFYLAGTTMHMMPGLVVLHSKDLVNWSFLSYCFDKLNMGDEFRLDNNKEAYGQGIWAPCIRYHNGKFYIFSNINGHGMQVFIAENPAGPWMHKSLGGDIYDLSVLFDDNGKIYAVYKYDEVKMIEIKADLSGYVENSEQVIIPAGNAMGEGHHIYKVNGKYYIISANFAPIGRMQCARADKIEGPYETVTISAKETMGTEAVHSVYNVGLGRPVPEDGFTFNVGKPDDNYMSAVPLHQGGIVDLPNGDWWGFSMMDFRSVGRTTCLSPVTWKDGWPYFGLSGNLGRSPRTWIKPNVEAKVTPHAPYQRSDDFDNNALLPIWQWNHEPVEEKWSLDKKKGVLRLHTMPAKDLLWAKNSLTQRSIGPVSTITVELDASKLKNGDIAGLGILNMPYAFIGLIKENNNLMLRHYNQLKGVQTDVKLESKHARNDVIIGQKLSAKNKIKLRITADYDNDIAQMSYSKDGNSFINLGDSVLLPYQLKTFQGTRIALFAYNTIGQEGGYAEFDNFIVDEPMADRKANLPVNKVVTLKNKGTNTFAWANPHGMLHSKGEDVKLINEHGCLFKVHNRGEGKVVLEALNGMGFITVVGEGLSADVRLSKNETEDCLLMWQDMLRGQCMLLSLKTNQYIGLEPGTGEPYGANWPGARPDRKDGTVFEWNEVSPNNNN